MIRFLLIVVFLVLYLILGIPVLGIMYLYGKSHPYEADMIQLRIVQKAFKMILGIAGTKLIVIGEENVPKDTPVLYVGNHKSFFDIVITYSRTPIRCGYVSKVEMKKVPLLSIWMERLHCLFLDRDNIKEGLKTILQAIEQVKDGISICIYPEGTRNKTADLLMPFKEGSLKIADKSGCPIIPMAMTGSADIFENHFPFVRPTTVILEYGTPIYPKELSKEERKFLGAYTQNRMEEMLRAHLEMER